MPPEVAGRRTMRAGRPEWSPIPTSVVSRFKVVCMSGPDPTGARSGRLITT